MNTTQTANYFLLSGGIGLCIFGVLGIIFWVNPTMNRMMNDVDDMVKQWSEEKDCTRLMTMKDVIDANQIANAFRPDIKLTLEKRIIELGCN